MILAFISLMAILLFYAIGAIVILYILKKKFGLKPVKIIVSLILFTILVYSIWNQNWLLAAATAILGFNLYKEYV
ncbi:hypothetical protein [Paenibacillus oleatilyticus]|uniref:hypothetical protein n=1 Tax=Paenibacillus oleatilyticus TaxID=2594886 RepID=UPI001C1F780D|nr:hypothetical protein [Paenibacillus oleatilyticus]MBU7316011.1 hypothetical protein [Paenibacillus oleatilyticus]